MVAFCRLLALDFNEVRKGELTFAIPLELGPDMEAGRMTEVVLVSVEVRTTVLLPVEPEPIDEPVSAPAELPAGAE